MDLDAFNELVRQFLLVFPATEEPRPIFEEELEEFYDEVEVKQTSPERKAELDKEWGDGLWVWLLIGHYHNVDMPKVLAYIANKNYVKMKHKHLFTQDPVTGKWCKPPGFNEMVESGELK